MEKYQYQQRRTEYADAILERSMGAHRLAKDLARPGVTPNEVMALSFTLHSWALDLGRLSEAVRNSKRLDEEKPAALFKSATG